MNSEQQEPYGVDLEPAVAPGDGDTRILHNLAIAKDDYFAHIDTCIACCTIGTMSCQEGLRLRAVVNELEQAASPVIHGPTINVEGHAPSRVISRLAGTKPMAIAQQRGGQISRVGACHARCRRSTSPVFTCRCHCGGADHGRG